MKTYRILIQPRARAEAMESFRWLAERSPAAATRWYSGLQKAIAKLAAHPERHPIAEEESEPFRITIRQCFTVGGAGFTGSFTPSPRRRSRSRRSATALGGRSSRDRLRPRPLRDPPLPSQSPARSPS